MSEAARLVDQLARAHHGDPWHGSPVAAILQGVTSEQAARRPPKGAHSIWELVLHMTAWRNEAADRARGRAAGEPREGDWPSPGEATPAEWRATLGALDAAHQNLVAAVRDLPDDQLVKPTSDPRNAALGAGVSDYELLHGIVQHDAYHAGQIAMVRKILGF